MVDAGSVTRYLKQLRQQYPEDKETWDFIESNWQDFKI